ncbi:hypothetical protein AB0G15_05575 [Streptosporangium sp. NPDC023825]|uniref:hypothetical protein n=1 Tax=Streptosporangium sp. NPDC023825 TaxID=3154909 RepID=UPI003431B7A4
MGKTNASLKNTSASGTGRAASRPRAGSGVGGALDAVMNGGIRRHTSERLGSVGAPQTTYAPQTTSAAGATERNIKLLPPAMRYTEPFSAPISYGR